MLDIMPRDMADSISYAKRIIYTVLLSGTSYLTTSSASVIGLSLPDIQCLLGIDLKVASCLLFAYGLGMCCSSLTGHFIRDNVDTTLCLVATLVLNAVVVAAIPISPFVWLTFILVLIAGWCTGIMSLVRVIQCYIIWTTNFFGVFCIALGTSISMITTPLIAKHFLEHRRFVPVDVLLSNMTRSVEEQRCDRLNSAIRYPFLISSGLGLLLAISFLYSYNTFLQKGDAMEVTPTTNGKPALYRSPSLMFIIFTMGTAVMSSASLISFLELFVSYGIRCQLHLSVGEMSLLASGFSVGVFVSRLVSLILSDRIWIEILVLSYVLLVNVASVLFILFKDTSVTMLWTNCIMYALGSGSMFPGLIAWVQKYSYRSPQFLNVIMFFDYCGSLIFPALSALLIGMFGPDAFIYTMAGIAFTQLPLFIGLWCVSIEVKNEADLDNIDPLISDH